MLKILGRYHKDAALWVVCPCVSGQMPQGSGGQMRNCGEGRRSPKCHGSRWPPPEHRGWTHTAPTGEHYMKKQWHALFLKRIDSFFVCVWQLTSVWTRKFLCVRTCFRKPRTFTVPWSWICCSMLSTTMYVPVLPTPALWHRSKVKRFVWSRSETKNTHTYLQCTSTGPISCVRAREDALMKDRTGRVYSGTPMSGHWV